MLRSQHFSSLRRALRCAVTSAIQSRLAARTRSQRGRLAPLTVGCALLVWVTLLGVNSVQAQTAQAGALLTVGTGWTAPKGVALDAAGNAYVVEGNSIQNPIVRLQAVNGVIPPSPNSTTVLNSVVPGNFGIAIDKQGDLFYATDGAILEVLAVNGTIPSSNQSVLTLYNAGNSFAVGGITFDTAGNLYASEESTVGQQLSRIVELQAVNGVIPSVPASSTIPGSSVLAKIGNVAIDPQGNVFAGTSNGLIEIVAVNGAIPASPTVVTLEPTIAGGVAVDGQGNLYYCTYLASGTLYEIFAVNGSVPTSNPTSVPLASGLSYVTGLARDNAGDIFLAQSLGNNTLSEFTSGVEPFPATAIGSTSQTEEVAFTFTGAGTLSSTTPYVVLTQGVQNLDFKPASTQSSTQCVTGHSYAVGDTCTVDVTFTPTRPGQRLGAVQINGSAGTPIATYRLRGTGVGPMATFPSNGGVITFPRPAGGYTNLQGIAVDGTGNVYVTAAGGGTPGGVYEIVASNGAVSTSSPIVPLAPGINQPTCLAIDGSGNLYVSDTGATIKEILAVNGAVSAASGVISLPNNGITSALGCAVDANGNLYVADAAANAIREIVATNGVIGSSASVITLPSGAGYNNPQGVAVDSNGNVFVEDFGNGSVKEIVAVGGSVSTSSQVVTLLGNSTLVASLAVDGMGDLYVGSRTLGVQELVAVNGSVSASSRTLTLQALGGNFAATGLAVDLAGNVYVAATLPGLVLEIPVGTPPSIAFSATAPGSVQPAVGVTVQNSGNAPLTFTVPSSGTNPSFLTQNFPLSNMTTCPQLTSGTTGNAPTLAAGASCSYNITFAPQVVGSLVDSASILDNSLNVPSAQQIMLSGTATGSSTVTNATITATPSTQVAGGTSTVTVHVSNGTYGLQGKPVSISMVGPPGFSSSIGVSGAFTTDSNGNVVFTVSSPTTGQVNMIAVAGIDSVTANGSVTFANPTYLVTTLADDASGNAANCVVFATPTTAGNSNCSLRDATAAAYNQTATISFAPSLASAASPATLTLTNGNLGLSGNITINGPSANALTLSGGNQYQIFSIVGTASLSGLMLTNGVGNGGVGGAIYFNGSTLTLNAMEIDNNTAANYGGGLYISTGTANITNSTFAGNSVTASGSEGGAINAGNVTTALNITNSTFGGNTSAGDSGAIRVYSGTLSLTSVTISGNTAATTGGGVYATAGAVSIVDSIIWGNSAASYPDYVGNAPGTTWSLLNGGSGGIFGLPLMSPLGYYGGPTKTIIPEPGSGAICRANAGSGGGLTDQRGLTQPNTYCPQGSIDTGAVQTHWVLSFTTQPSNADQGYSLNPAPVVSLIENGILPSSFGQAGVSSNLTGNSTEPFSNGSAGFNFTPQQQGTTVLTATVLPSMSVNARVYSVTSQQFTVNAPLYISSQPQSATITSGQPTTLSVTAANGTTPYTYQWYQGNSGDTTHPIPGASSQTLIVSPTATTSYWVQITDAVSASLNSNTATLTIAAPPAVTSVAPNSGRPSGGNAVVITGTNFTGASNVSFGNTPALSFTVNSDTSITAVVPPGTGTVNITVTTPSGDSPTHAADQYHYLAPPTISIAFSPSAIDQGQTTTLTLQVANPSSGGTLTNVSFFASLPAGLTVANGDINLCGGDLLLTAPGYIALNGASIPPSGTCQASVTVTGASSGAYNLSINTVTSDSGGTGGPSNTATLTVNQAVSIPATNAATFTVGSHGSATVLASGGSSQYTFVESGAPPLGVSLSSAGVLSGTPASGTGGVYPLLVTVADSLGQTAQQNFTLTVNQAPAVTTNPLSQSVPYQSAALFTAAAAGYPTPTVQWQVSTNGGASFANVPNATSSTLSLGNVTVAMSGYQYRAVFTNSVTSANTTAATLTVTPLKPVVTWATPAAITYGGALGSGQLNATANVPGTFTYSPAAGTVLPVGQNQKLSVTFTPTDSTDYTTESASTITVNAANTTPATLVATSVLTRNTNGTISVTVTVANTGGTAAANAMLTSSTLGGVAPTSGVPVSLGSIAGGGQASATITFPNVGVTGAKAILAITGSFTGGNLTSSLRATLP